MWSTLWKSKSEADTLLISQEEFDFGALTPLMYNTAVKITTRKMETCIRKSEVHLELFLPTYLGLIKVTKYQTTSHFFVKHEENVKILSKNLLYT